MAAPYAAIFAPRPAPADVFPPLDVWLAYRNGLGTDFKHPNLQVVSELEYVGSGVMDGTLTDFEFGQY